MPWIFWHQLLPNASNGYGYMSAVS